MGTISNPARRLALAGGFAFAIAAAPMMAALAVPSAGPAPAVATCAQGETLNTETGECAPGVAPAQGGDISSSTPGDQNSVPEVNGIPCTGADTGKCIGLQEDQQAPAVEPSSKVSSSP